MKEIKLSNCDLVALVDDEDYDRIARYSWLLHDNGGAYRTPRGGTIQMSRIILNAPRGMDVDHKDRNRLNNQKWNLRLATRTQNNANSKKRDGCTSRFKGVYWHSQNHNWVSNIKKHGVRFSLGSFAREEDAALAYNAAARELFGEFARVNIIS